jgi:hypothetical protein
MECTPSLQNQGKPNDLITSQSLFRSEVGKTLMDIAFMINYEFIELLADDLADKEFA